MKTRHKIILIISLSVGLIAGGIVLGPVVFMIAANMYTGHVISTTPEHVFEKEFENIPEVKFFIEKFPNYSTSHMQDIIGWKIIHYESKQDDKSINLEVKKSVLHNGVRMSAGCNEGGGGYALDISQEQVMDYLKNSNCISRVENED